MADNDAPVSISPADRDIAIRTMIGEEGSPEGYAGVAATMLNRAQSGQYGGKSLSGVALAPGQFEPWSTRAAELRAIKPNDPRYVLAGQIFDGVASGEIPDLTNGATHFYAPVAQAKLGRQPPAWAQGQATQLGQTSFYAPSGAVKYQPAYSAPVATVAANAPPSSPKAPANDPVGKYLKPMDADPANDPILGRYLKPLPAAPAAPKVAPPTAPSAPVDVASDPILGRYLKPIPNAPQIATATDSSKPNIDPNFDAGKVIAERGPQEPQFDPTAPIGTQMYVNARDLGRYAIGQAKSVPGAIASNFRNSAELVGQGTDELSAGNYAPSFPSADPRTWSAGGVLKTVVGGLGAAMAPISGLVQAGVQEPVTAATGNPEIGEKAGFVANSLAGPMISRAIGGAPAALANKLVGGMSPEDAALADMARTKYGIPLNAGQMSGSNAVRFAGSVADRLPFSGSGADQANVANAFTRAVSNTFGEDADKITPNVMQAAKTRLGDEFNDIASKTTIKVDPGFVQDIHGALNDAQSVLGKDNVQPLINQVKKIYDTIDPKTGQISGESYQALTRKGTPLDNLMNSNDPNVRFYAGQLRDALDGAMERSAPPDLRARLTDARSQYKAMKTVENLVEKSPTGTISPAALLTPVRGSYGSMAYNGGGDLGNLARIGQRFLKEPPSSGTAERLGQMNMLQKAGAAGAAVLGLHQIAPAVVAPENALSLAASIPTSIAAGRVVGSVLRSKGLADNMINTSLGRVPPTSYGAADLIPLTAGGLSSPGLYNKFVNPLTAPVGSNNP